MRFKRLYCRVKSRLLVQAMLIIIPIVLLPLGCGEVTPLSEAEALVFMAGYKPQANLPFVAAYVAQEKGYFAEQNLTVDIRHASSGKHLKLLTAGDVHFTTAAATSVLKRRSEPNLPIVAVSLFGQYGQQTYVALRTSNIETLQDWKGKTFGYKISPSPDYLAMLKTAGVDRAGITEVNAGFDPRVLTEGRVDVLAVFKSNEPDTIRRLGFELNQWDPELYGVPSLGLTYITRQEFVETNPEIVQRFVKATLRGLQFAVDNRDEALEIVLKYAPGEDLDHQRFMLNSEIEDARGLLTETNGLGWMSDEQWGTLYKHLIEYGAIPSPFDYRTAFTNRFIDGAYDRGQLVWP